MVRTTLQYLARETLYQSEKPYSADFEIEEHDGVKKSNYVLTKESVVVSPMDRSNKFTLDTNGFCIIKSKTALQADQVLSNPQSVEAQYFDELRAIIFEHFPEYTQLEPMEFVVSLT